MFAHRTIQPHRPVEHTETAAEALAVSLNELGHVDMEYKFSQRERRHGL